MWGVPVRHHDRPRSTKINSTSKLWLGVLDKLPYKQEGESDSVLHKGSKTKTSGTWEYDPNLKIEAPIQ